MSPFSPLAIVLAGCADVETVVSTEPAQPTDPEAVPELNCQQAESAVYDFGEDARGSPTLAAALTAFGDTPEGRWLDQLSRSVSIQRDPGVVVVYRDSNGRPAGLVYLERRERGWLVVGSDRCV